MLTTTQSRLNINLSTASHFHCHRASLQLHTPSPTLASIYSPASYRLDSARFSVTGNRLQSIQFRSASCKMVMVANRLQAMSPDIYHFGASRNEDQSPTTAVKHELRDSYPMHENQIHASNILRSVSATFNSLLPSSTLADLPKHPLGALLEQHLPEHDYALIARSPNGHYETVTSHSWQAQVEQIYSEKYRSKLGFLRIPGT